jgi:hypothetical protein
MVSSVEGHGGSDVLASTKRAIGGADQAYTRYIPAADAPARPQLSATCEGWVSPLLVSPRGPGGLAPASPTRSGAADHRSSSNASSTARP